MNIKKPCVIDIWEPNVVTDWTAADGWIIKASEGVGITDAAFVEHWKGAQGRPRAPYHFYRKAYTGGQNARNFFNAVNSGGGLLAGDRLALDCEEQGMSLRDGIVDTLYNIQLLFQIPYSRIILYSTESILDNLSDAKLNSDQRAILMQVAIWSAGYPNNPDAFSVPPADYVPDQTRYGKVDFWQYAGDVNPANVGLRGITVNPAQTFALLNQGLGHAGISLRNPSLTISGITGGIDLNWVDADYFTQWQAETAGNVPQPTPAPVPPPAPAPQPPPTPAPQPQPSPDPNAPVQYLFGGKIAYTKMVMQYSTAHIMVVDMTSGAKLFFSPPNRNGYLVLMTPENLLHWQNLQLCMNGPDQFYWPKPNQKALVYPAGLAAYQGNIYHRSTNEETLYVDANSVCSFDAPPKGQIYYAASFPKKAVANGSALLVGDNQRKPRSAFGWWGDNSKVVFIKVDGNEAQGLGMTFDEVSSLLILYGVENGIHCDGGYSSDMCIEGADGQPQTIGMASNNNIPGQIAQVGMSFGVYWE